MANININSIHGGISPTLNQGEESSYLGAKAIDPDIKINGRIGGVISPNNYEKSVSAVSGVNWFEPNDQNDDIYYYTKDGDFGYIDASGSANEVTSVSGSSGNGLKYYNNYYYLATDEDIHRYGPMDASAQSLEENWWTGYSSGDVVLQANGDTETIEYGGKEKISQSINEIIETDKIYLGLQNTGTNTTYSIKVSIQGKSTTKVRPLGDFYVGFEYDLDYPDGEELISKVISAPSNTMEIVEVDFGEIISINGEHSIVIETENPLEANQSFNVMVSDFGNEYTKGMASTYDSDWETTPTLTWDTDTTSKSATHTVIHSHTLSLKDSGVLETPLNVKFRVTPAGTTDDWVFTMKKNGVNIPNADVSVVIKDTSNTTLYSSDNSNSASNLNASVSGTTTVNVHFTIKTTAELEHNDIIQIDIVAIDTEDDPIEMTIDNYRAEGTSKRRPYFSFEDETKAVDIGFKIVNIDTQLNKIKNETYPSIKNYTIPNHHIFSHTNGTLYITDFQDKRGVLHSFRAGTELLINEIDGSFSTGDIVRGKTSRATATIISVSQELSTTTKQLGLGIDRVYGEFEVGEEIENITENSTAEVVSLTIGKSIFSAEENSLFLKKEQKPSVISSYGTDIVIGTIGSNGAKLFFWDTFAGSFYREVMLPYPTVSALINHNGDLFVFGGSDSLSFGRYIGGDTIEELFHCDHAGLPLQGAVRSYHNRIIFGSYQTYPSNSGCVWAWGSKATVPQRLHNIITTPTQVSSLITKNEEGEMILSDDGIYEKGGEYNSTWRSQVYNFSQRFELTKITIPFSSTFGASPDTTEVKVKIYYDDGRTTDEHTITLESDSKSVSIYPIQKGTTNFYLEITWQGNTFTAVNLPIRITYNILE